MRYFVWVLLLVAPPAIAQDSIRLTLESCRELARQHYPLLRRQQVLDKVLQLQQQNIRTTWLPQAEVNGQATWQSEVVHLPVKMPGFNIPTLSKDQYRATIDVKQLLYDGGISRKQQDLQEAQQLADKQKVETDLFRIREQVTQSFFNALLAAATQDATRLAAADLQQRIEKLQAGVANGTVLPSAVDLLQAELLKTDQQQISATASRNASLQALSILTGTDITPTAILEVPYAEITPADTLHRPELALYRLQSGVLQQQSEIAGTRNRPKLSAFVQGGYGRPGLNMLSNSFDAFYLGGIRLNWTLWNWRNNRREQEILALQQKNIDAQADAFTLNTRVQLARQHTEIIQLQETLEKDKAIIVLRERVKEAAAAQLDNGVITVHDYLTDLNAITQARISCRTHELQLAMARISYQLIQGN